MKHKKSFDWYNARQRFSIRKYHFGAASVLLGTALALGGGQVQAEEVVTNNPTVVEATGPTAETPVSDAVVPEVPTETSAPEVSTAIPTDTPEVGNTVIAESVTNAAPTNNSAPEVGNPVSTESVETKEESVAKYGDQSVTKETGTSSSDYVDSSSRDIMKYPGRTSRGGGSSVEADPQYNVPINIYSMQTTNISTGGIYGPSRQDYPIDQPTIEKARAEARHWAKTIRPDGFTHGTNIHSAGGAHEFLLTEIYGSAYEKGDKVFIPNFSKRFDLTEVEKLGLRLVDISTNGNLLVYDNATDTLEGNITGLFGTENGAYDGRTSLWFTDGTDLYEYKYNRHNESTFYVKDTTVPKITTNNTSTSITVGDVANISVDIADPGSYEEGVKRAMVDYTTTSGETEKLLYTNTLLTTGVASGDNVYDAYLVKTTLEGKPIETPRVLNVRNGVAPEYNALQFSATPITGVNWHPITKTFEGEASEAGVYTITLSAKDGDKLTAEPNYHRWIHSPQEAYGLVHIDVKPKNVPLNIETGDTTFTVTVSPGTSTTNVTLPDGQTIQANVNTAGKWVLQDGTEVGDTTTNKLVIPISKEASANVGIDNISVETFTENVKAVFVRDNVTLTDRHGVQVTATYNPTTGHWELPDDYKKVVTPAENNGTLETNRQVYTELKPDGGIDFYIYEYIRPLNEQGIVHKAVETSRHLTPYTAIATPDTKTSALYNVVTYNKAENKWTASDGSDVVATPEGEGWKIEVASGWSGKTALRKSQSFIAKASVKNAKPTITATNYKSTYGTTVDLVKATEANVVINDVEDAKNNKPTNITKVKIVSPTGKEQTFDTVADLQNYVAEYTLNEGGIYTVTIDVIDSNGVATDVVVGGEEPGTDLGASTAQTSYTIEIDPIIETEDGTSDVRGTVTVKYFIENTEEAVANPDLAKDDVVSTTQKYVKKSGEVVVDRREVTTPSGATFDTKPFIKQTVTADNGRVYEFVGLRSGVEAGTLEAGDKEVIYNYRLVTRDEVTEVDNDKGTVKVRYVLQGADQDIKDPQDAFEGVVNKIKTTLTKSGEVEINKVVETVPTGVTYNVTNLKENSITAADGRVYEYASTTGNEQDTLAVGETVIKHEYRLVTNEVPQEVRETKQGTVEVKYLIQGETTEIRPKATAKTGVVETSQTIITMSGTAEVGRRDIVTPITVAYDTEPFRHAEIIADDGKVYTYVDKRSGDEQGNLIDGTLTVEYDYVLKKAEEKDGDLIETRGKVNVRFVDETTLTDIIPSETAINEIVKTVQNYVTKSGSVVIDRRSDEQSFTHEFNTKPLIKQTIEVGDKTYAFIAKHAGDETGTLAEGDHEVVYTYRLVETDVPDTAPDYDLPKLKINTHNIPGQPPVPTDGTTPPEGFPPVPYKEVPNETGGTDYHYKWTGSVIVRYVDPEGNVLLEETDTPESDTDTPYNTEEFKKGVITITDKEYQFVEVKDGSDPEDGVVEKGQKVVVYVYKPTEKVVPNDPPTHEKPKVSINTHNIPGKPPVPSTDVTPPPGYPEKPYSEVPNETGGIDFFYNETKKPSNPPTHEKPKVSINTHNIPGKPPVPSTDVTPPPGFPEKPYLEVPNETGGIDYWYNETKKPSDPPTHEKPKVSINTHNIPGKPPVPSTDVTPPPGFPEKPYLEVPNETGGIDFWYNETKKPSDPPSYDLPKGSINTHNIPGKPPVPSTDVTPPPGYPEKPYLEVPNETGGIDYWYNETKKPSDPPSYDLPKGSINTHNIPGKPPVPSTDVTPPPGYPERPYLEVPNETGGIDFWYNETKKPSDPPSYDLPKGSINTHNIPGKPPVPSTDVTPPPGYPERPYLEVPNETGGIDFWYNETKKPSDPPSYDLPKGSINTHNIPGKPPVPSTDVTPPPGYPERPYLEVPNETGGIDYWYNETKKPSDPPSYDLPKGSINTHNIPGKPPVPSTDVTPPPGYPERPYLEVPNETGGIDFFYNETKKPSDPPSYDLPKGSINTHNIPGKPPVPSTDVTPPPGFPEKPYLEVPNETGGIDYWYNETKKPSNPPTHEKPELEIGIVPNEAPSHDKPELDKPELNIPVKPEEPNTPPTPEVPSTPTRTVKELPKTGDTSGMVTVASGAMSLALARIVAARRRRR